ncbi:MAG: SBBP repeat-containing protein [Gammaproteobacteria bacterium]|nr:SBBP repeat-containing protein [Gammaproteobacteria bacterium]
MSESDFATIKYDSMGNELWLARFNGPANGKDYAKVIAVDNVGNVYVAGIVRVLKMTTSLSNMIRKVVNYGSRIIMALQTVRIMLMQW